MQWSGAVLWCVTPPIIARNSPSSHSWAKCLTTTAVHQGWTLSGTDVKRGLAILSLALSWITDNCFWGFVLEKWNQDAAQTLHTREKGLTFRLRSITSLGAARCTCRHRAVSLYRRRFVCLYRHTTVCLFISMQVQTIIQSCMIVQSKLHFCSRWVAVRLTHYVAHFTGHHSPPD